MSDANKSEKATLTFDARTLMLTAVLFGGGTVGGGTISAIAGDRVPTDVRESIASTRQTVERLDDQLRKIEQTLLKSTAGDEAIREDTKRLERLLDDHERRLRELEVRRAPR